jgi:hypothetical protein
MVNYGQLIDGPKPFVQGGLDGVYTFAPNLMQDSGNTYINFSLKNLCNPAHGGTELLKINKRQMA